MSVSSMVLLWIRSGIRDCAYSVVVEVYYGNKQLKKVQNNLGEEGQGVSLFVFASSDEASRRRQNSSSGAARRVLLFASGCALLSPSKTQSKELLYLFKSVFSSQNKSIMIYSVAILAAAAAVGVAEANNGVWCAEPGHKSRDEITALKGLPGISYRGQFKDFSIFVEDNGDVVPNCEVFAEHSVGDDGLWVIEEPTREAAAATKASILAAGQKVYYEYGLSLVAGGGTLLPNITGLDGCGAAQDTAIIPVPSHSVGPTVLSKAQTARWVTQRQAGIQANSEVQSTVDAVSEAALIATVDALQTINTRNSYSETLYDAEKYAVGKFEELGFTISYHQYLPNVAPNVIATWPSTNQDTEFVVAGAHLDSRSEDSTSKTDRAPGTCTILVYGVLCCVVVCCVVLCYAMLWYDVVW
jgi:hypothetical protein